MKKIMIALAVGAAALMGGSAANAAGADKTAKPATEVNGPTDVSSQGRHYHGHHHHGMRGHRHHYRHYGHRHYRPHYYNSYGYQRPYGYYGGGPGVTFSFGNGGYRGW